MLVEEQTAVAIAPSWAPRANPLVRSFVQRPPVLIGSIIMILFLLTAAFAPVLAPYDPNAQNLTNVLQPPSAEHWLGTDALGRDTLSRLIYGARVSLLVSVLSVAAGAIVGAILGLVAGYKGGWYSTIIMRFADALAALPPLFFTLVLVATLSPGVRNVMIAVAVALLPGYIRLTAGQTLSLREREFVQAARAIGCSDWYIMIRHILPNCLSSLTVQATLSVGGAMLVEGALSFLSLGITPPTPAWGSMVQEGYRYLTTHPILSMAPGLALMAVVFAVNMVGDGLRDYLDPRIRGEQ